MRKWLMPRHSRAALERWLLARYGMLKKSGALRALRSMIIVREVITHVKSIKPAITINREILVHGD